MSQPDLSGKQLNQRMNENRCSSRSSINFSPSHKTTAQVNRESRGEDGESVVTWVELSDPQTRIECEKDPFSSLFFSSSLQFSESKRAAKNLLQSVLFLLSPLSFSAAAAGVVSLLHEE